MTIYCAKCGHRKDEHFGSSAGRKSCLVEDCPCTCFAITVTLRNPLLDELALSDLGAYDAEEQTLP